MAYTQKSASPGSSIVLGSYTFRLSAQYNESADTSTCTVFCVAGDKQATRRQTVNGKVLSWSVEANEAEASVYINTRRKALNTGPVSVPFPHGSSGRHGNSYSTWTYTGAEETFAYASKYRLYHIFASDVNGTPVYGSEQSGTYARTDRCTTPFTFHGLTVYYTSFVGSSWSSEITFVSPDCGNGKIVNLSSENIAAICWIMIYGEIYEDTEYKLLGRFAINLGDAGGYPGGGGGWISPGDWNIDPTTTLHLTVNGALSGRHNDPLNDASFSYVPADKATVKDYGTGGDGGNGGGGGAGASTIIVRQFATNKANSKDILALAKRHGYGSGGGKGGNGGDGCILIYY